MVKTERLHYDDPLALVADATVLAHDRRGDLAAVVLDRTPFYPESGGQLGDHGTLATNGTERRVVDVQIEDGVVRHAIEGAPPPIGATVRAEVDGARRREHMALHSGQHALSRALLDLCGATTISSRLGATECTIDVDRDGLTADDLRRVEDRVNALVDRDLPVRQAFCDEVELARLALRKPPPSTDRVRVVDLGGFDVSPCGGTHVTHTAQIELVWVHGFERYKGGTRVRFEAGPRARRKLRAESDLVRAVAAELRCAPLELSAILASHRQKLDAARDEAGALRAQLADAWARQLAAREDEAIVSAIEGADRALLQAIAARLATGRRLVALTAPSDDGAHVLVARGDEADADCGAILRALAKTHGARGGGRPQMAEGRLPAGVTLRPDDLRS